MYSPKIEEKLVRLMYQVKVRHKKPITHTANELLKEALKEKYPELWAKYYDLIA